MNDIIDIMMRLIKSEICQSSLELTRDLTDDDLDMLYKISKHHDLAHIVGRALIKNSLVKKDEIGNKFKQAVHKAAFRFLKLNKAQNEIFDAFEKNEIPFIPLKGTVIRKFYPEPWMRTSCDIDILVKPEYMERASDVLTQFCNYTAEKDVCELAYDISYFSKNNDIHIELHHSLTAVNEQNKILLNGVWSNSDVVDSFKYRFNMRDDYFYFHQLFHLAKHFKSGGAGVRAYIDLWILNHNVSFDKEKRNKLLNEFNLLKFEEISVKLSEIWFGNEKHNELTHEVEDFVIGSGVYGNVSNSIISSRAKKENKFTYIFSRLWMPYDTLIIKYPSLKKRPYLFLFYEIYRIIEVLFSSKLKSAANEVKIINSASDEKVMKRNKMFAQLGLD